MVGNDERGESSRRKLLPGGSKSVAYGTLTDVTANEQEALASQLRVEDVKLSFFSIFSYATWPETVLIAICTICAIVAGSLVPFTPVILTASSIDQRYIN